MSDRDIVFERRGAIDLVTLNRPKALNALTLEMARALDGRLCEDAADPAVGAVVVQGAGDRAYCAGGDIRRLYDEGRAGGRYPFEFYHDEYRLNARVFHFPKPFVALMDGIVMGGGVGLSVHGSHRVATERITFAMPETGIGLFPDVGGGFFLPRLPGQVGMFMALTGYRLKLADALHAGVADLYVPSERLDDLIDALAAADYTTMPSGTVSHLLMRFAERPDEAPLAGLRARIDYAFAGASVEDILDRLGGDEWAGEQRAALRLKSPTSMKIAFRQLRTGRTLGFNDVMRMEWRIANGCIAGHDFYEGVRAAIVDKDQAPKWRPASLEDLPDSEIAPYFEAVPKDGDLEFPADLADKT